MKTKIEKRAAAAQGVVSLSSLREALLLLVGTAALGVVAGMLASPSPDERACVAFCAGAGAPLLACASDGTALCGGGDGITIRYADGTITRMRELSSAEEVFRASR